MTYTEQHERGILRPGIRTFKPRRSRITERQSTALREQTRWLLDDTGDVLDPAEIWGRDTPVVLEIGFGTGEATVQMAAADPDTGILALDVHTPGVGNLLDVIARRGLTNVRVMEADAIGVLSAMTRPGSLAGVRSFFPDPWPKARHHKRRLVQPSIMNLVASRITAGGFWHLATDWPEYVDSIMGLFESDAAWIGGVIERPDWRPETKYERRALREGRHIADLEYRTVTTGSISP